jgi:membrane dipeptidase
MQTRKEFLKNIGAFVAGSSLLSLAGVEQFAFLPKKNSIYFDLHCHVGLALSKIGIDTPAGLAKLLQEMQTGHLTGGFFALVADLPLLQPGPKGVNVTGKYASDDGWKEYKRQLQLLKALFNQGTLPFSTKVNDLNPHHASPRAFLAVEGGDFLEGQVGRIEETYQDGVRSIQLVHYAPNEVGDLQTSANTFNGLSAFGKDMVKKMNEVGMVIDVAHATYQTTKDAASLTKSPIILSHSILEMDADRPIAARAISKDHAKAVADTGGVIGAWPSGFNKNFDEYVDNIQRLIDVVGIDHVGIGTDMQANFKPVLTNYTEFPKLAAALAAKGLTPTEVSKVMGGNAKNVLSKVLK